MAPSYSWVSLKTLRARLKRVPMRGGAFVLLHLVHDLGIIRRVHDHGHVLVVLGRGPQQRGAADVDVFDGVLQSAIGFGNGLLELVEVDHHQVDGFNAVGRHLLLVAGQVPASQDAAMDLGVQSLDPAIQHLGEAGELRDLHYGDTIVPQELGGTSGGENFYLVTHQKFGELRQTALIGNAHQGSGYGFQGVPPL